MYQYRLYVVNLYSVLSGSDRFSNKQSSQMARTVENITFDWLPYGEVSMISCGAFAPDWRLARLMAVPPGVVRARL